jgi:hypothetical protein
MSAIQPLARLNLPSPAAGTKAFLAVWEFSAFRKWPDERISYTVDHEWVVDDADETSIKTTPHAKVDILPDGLHISFADGSEVVDPTVTTSTWASSPAGIEVLGGIQTIVNLVAGVNP